MRIEVAYGFEGVLTDVTARRIIGETVAPYFKQGQFAQGINAGVDRIIEVIGTGEPLPVETTGGRPTRHSFDFGNLFIILLVAVPIVGTILRSMFGNVGGSVIGGGLAGAVAWFVAGSLLIAAGAGVVAFIIIIFSMFSGGRGGGWFPGGGGGGIWRRWRRRGEDSPAVVEASAAVAPAGVGDMPDIKPEHGSMEARSPRLKRIARHFATDHRSVRRAFPPEALARIEAATARGEQAHAGQVRFVVESALPLGAGRSPGTPRMIARWKFSAGFASGTPKTTAAC